VITRKIRFYYLSSAVLAATFVLLLTAANSPFGHVSKANRENPFRAEALGYYTVFQESMNLSVWSAFRLVRQVDCGRFRWPATGVGMAKILIVDDEPLITAMLEDWLLELGHDVVGPAHNLAKALELAKSEIDAAIVDVSLGKDNAYPLVEALMARGLPLVLATAMGETRRHRPEISHTVDPEETI
jgi:CheY-like chemotaxis protein